MEMRLAHPVIEILRMERGAKRRGVSNPNISSCRLNGDDKMMSVRLSKLAI